jgi:divalent metal cation (Fe/Co/Zn/Cd) transporter
MNIWKEEGITMSTKTHNDRIVAVVLMIMAVLIFVSSIRIPKSELASLQMGPGPSAFPIFLAVLLAVLSICLFVVAGRKGKDLEEAPEEAAAVQSESTTLDVPLGLRLSRILGAIGMMIVYFLGLPYAGFILSTIIFGMAFLVLIFKMSVKKSILPAVTISLFCYLMFELGLKIPLPAFMQSLR